MRADMPKAAEEIDPRNPHYAPRRPEPLGGDVSRMPYALPEAQAIELPRAGLERVKSKACASGTSRNFIECPLVDGGAGPRAYFASAGGKSDELGTILMHERGAAGMQGSFVHVRLAIQIT